MLPHLLMESALRLEGTHLGSIWIKPSQNEDLLTSVMSSTDKPAEKNYVDYPSRPIQLAKILHETSVIWNKAKADPAIANQFASGTEISCPILDENNNRQTIPFCYVIEVKRSPLAPQQFVEEPDIITQELFSPTNIARGLKGTKKKGGDPSERHLPVFYSIRVHPPIVIEVSVWYFSFKR